MMRVCHLDTCPVGIATQNPELRKRFTGKPEFVTTFFEYIAEEVRELLAGLGLRSIEEAVGRSELLDAPGPSSTGRPGGSTSRPCSRCPSPPTTTPGTRRACRTTGSRRRSTTSSWRPARRPSHDGTRVEASVAITNGDRSVGTLLGCEITRRHGGTGLPDGTITINFTGSAGQSFGAFVPRGVTMRLSGDANDYFGKGLSGGRLVAFPPPESPVRRRGADHRRQRHALRGDRAARPSSGARWGSASACATPAPTRWSRAWATTAAST